MNPNDHISQIPIPLDVVIPTQEELQVTPLKARPINKKETSPPSTPSSAPSSAPSEASTMANSVEQNDAGGRRKGRKGTTKCIYFRDAAQMEELCDLVADRGSSSSAIMSQLIAAFLKAYKEEEDKTVNRGIKVPATMVWL